MRSKLILVLLVLLMSFGRLFAWQTVDSLSLKHATSQGYKLYLSYPDSSIAIAHTVLAQTRQDTSRYFRGYAYLILARANWTKSNYQLSMEYGFKSLALLENSAYKNEWGQSLLALARTSIEINDWPQALNFLNDAERVAIEHHDNGLLADTYRERSLLLTENKQFDSSLYYVDKGLVIYHTLQDTLNLSVLYSRKVKIYYALGHYNKSLVFNKLALRLDSLVDNKRALGVSFYYAAQIAYHLDKTDSAIYYLRQSLKVSHSVKNINSIYKAHTLLAEIYETTNRPVLAVSELKLAAQYKDSLFNAEKNSKIEELKSLYELEHKDQTIRHLEEENLVQQHRTRDQRWLTIVLAIGIVLLTAFILMLSRLRTLQKKANHTLEEKNRSIEQQSEEIHAQAEYLQHLNQLKSKLFSVISHDVRGPIATLQSLMELVTSKVMTQDEFLQVSDKLKTSLNITQQTLENLLNWSLSQMDGIRTDKKSVKLHTAVYEVSNLLSDVAERKGVTIKNEIHSDIRVLADTNQLQLILRNLIHNAIKFSKSNAPVIVSAIADATTCSIMVKDFGIGMTPEEVNKINDEEHFTKRGTQQEKGTGLGLFLCKEFIKHNGGELAVKSESGTGTEISFTLFMAD